MKKAATTLPDPTPLRAPTRKNGTNGSGEEIDLKDLLQVLTAFKRGDFTVRMPDHLTGLGGKIADALNDVIAKNERMTKELDRVARSVGKEGRITQRATVSDVSNSWEDSLRSVNTLISDLVFPTSETTRVIGALANSELSKTMATELEGRPLEGEFLRAAKTVNTMVDQLGAFASEV